MPELGNTLGVDVRDVAEDPDHDEVLVEITDLLFDRRELLKLDEEIRREYPVDGRSCAGDAAAAFWVYHIEPGHLKR